MRLAFAFFLLACGGKPPEAPRPAADDRASPGPAATPCDQLIAERPNYKLCVAGDRFVELIEDNTGSWSPGKSIPRGGVRDHVGPLILLGGDCDHPDDVIEPANICLFGRWHKWDSTRRTYAVAPALAGTPTFPRTMLLAPYGRVIATNGKQVGVIGLHGDDWRLTPIDAPTDCGEPTLAKPLAHLVNIFNYSFAVGYQCGSERRLYEIEIGMMEDSNQVRIEPKPPVAWR